MIQDFVFRASRKDRGDEEEGGYRVDCSCLGEAE